MAVDDQHLIPRFTKDQWFILSLAIVGLIASFLLQVKPDDPESVYFRLSDTRLPGTCFSRQWLDMDCPGCGLTRSVVCISQGELTRSIRFNLGGIVFYVFALGYIGYALTRKKIPANNFFHTAAAWKTFVWLVVIVLTMQWLIKLF